MKHILRFKYEFLSVIFAALSVYCAFFLPLKLPSSSFGRFVHVITTAAALLSLYLSLRALWREKLRRPAAMGLQWVFSKLSDFSAFLDSKLFDKLRRLFSLPPKAEKVLRGKTTVNFDFSFLDKKDKRAYRPPKWKNMEDGRSRMRFLYRRMITERLKRLEARPWNTPCELKSKEENTEAQNELYDLYISARYDERKEIGFYAMEELKKRLDEE